jgi:hypothetical protein
MSMNEPATETAPLPVTPLSAAETLPLRARLVRTHLRFGWIGLLGWAMLGITLEGLHAFKSSAYLGVGREVRRLMWTLAHAHGIGFSLVHVALAATVGLLLASAAESGAAHPQESKLVLGSRLLGWASLLIPGGFFLGGVVTYEGDPGIGVILVPVGAVLLMVSLVCIVWVLMAERRA